MLFNAAKTYVQQLDSGKTYTDLHPVYALAILNGSYDEKTKEFYHRYQIANRENTNEVIEGLELIMVELPKFMAKKWSDRRMAVLWLRFLKEMKHGAEFVPEDLLTDESIREAAEICEEGGFTEVERAVYDKNWDTIRNELSVITASIEKGEKKGLAKGLEEGEKKGLAKGIAKGLEEGEKKGLAKGLEEGEKKGLAKGHAEGLEEGEKKGSHAKTVQFVRSCARRGMSRDDIADIANLSAGEVAAILEETD
jgi:predicted transposase/invertase (TIGR01784 family)